MMGVLPMGLEEVHDLYLVTINLYLVTIDLNFSNNHLERASDTELGSILTLTLTRR